MAAEDCSFIPSTHTWQLTMTWNYSSDFRSSDSIVTHTHVQTPTQALAASHKFVIKLFWFCFKAHTAVSGVPDLSSALSTSARGSWTLTFQRLC